MSNAVNPQWKFKPLLPSDMHVDPTHDEFFTTQDVGGLNHALIREAIQNSLDAKNPADESPLFVRFSFRSLNPKDEFLEYINALQPHLDASQNGIVNVLKTSESVRILTIEDFSTVGLEGDPGEGFVDPDDPGQHNFYFFWRNIGRSEKKEGDRGRWGLGKAVFPVVSSIRTFFGYTIRDSDSRSLLMGHSLLRIHKTEDGSWFHPYGYYGLFNDEDDSHFVSPIENQELIKPFIEHFSISRRAESGLSIAIPFVRPGINIISTAYAVLTEFFYPILAGNLEIWIEEDSQVHLLNADTIDEVAKTMEPDGEDFDLDTYLRLLDFTRWVLDRKSETDFIRLNAQDWQRAPSWSEELIETEVLEELKQKFQRGERIAFHVPMKVQLTGDDPHESTFDVFLENDPKLEKRENHFIREDLRVSGIKSLKQNGIRGMVVVSEDPLVEMLGDAENPAHTDWQKDSRGFKGKYKHATSCMYFVINSLRYLPYYLTSVGETTDVDLLKDIFFLPGNDISADESKPGSDSAGGDETPEPKPEPPSKPKPVRISEIDRGFSIHPTKDIGDTRTFYLRVAYDVSFGNPISKYTSADFDLRYPPIEISGSGFEKVERNINNMKLISAGNEFELKVIGFDPNRDLLVDVQWDEVS